MAIVAEFNIPGMTADQYDRVVQELEAKGAGAPKGRTFHVAGPTDTGWRVVDVWESEEHLDRFGETLIPVLVAADVTHCFDTTAHGTAVLAKQFVPPSQ